MHESLSERLRPQQFEDLLQPSKVISLLKAMADRKSPANVLFYGTPGLGKTSAVRILLKALGDNSWEVNGSIHTGVDDVRQIREGATSAGLGEGPRVCFIDEAEYLSRNAQAGLRGLIEEVSGHCRFILTANDIRKLHPGLRSRCQPVCFDIPVAETKEVIERQLPSYITRLRQVGVTLNDQRVRELFYIYFPDLRALANIIEFETLASRERPTEKVQP